MRKKILILIISGLLFHVAYPCTMPVFRYALERWPSDYHIVTVSAKLGIPIDELNRCHHANLWIQKATSRQSSEVIVTYPGSDKVWYEGDWSPSLPGRLSDSPLRREIANELLTGTTASWILLEGNDSLSNQSVFEKLKKRLDFLEEKLELDENPDFEDELDGFAGLGGPLSKIPLKVDFSQHRLSRNNEAEYFFIRQILGALPGPIEPDDLVAVVVFGQGRMLLLSEQELLPEVISEVCYFLCCECSCRIKAMNPGLDMLIAANWNESVYWYPEQVETTLPGGKSFYLSETKEHEPKLSDGGQNAESIPAESVDNQDSGSNINLNLIIVVAIIFTVVIIFLGWFLVNKKRQSNKVFK